LLAVAAVVEVVAGRVITPRVAEVELEDGEHLLELLQDVILRVLHL
jgi:hypothetical protein|tara:strand:- start:360 stop:497 length:138 start_codon:yes stop_codon:yes gene_type:complete